MHSFELTEIDIKQRRIVITTFPIGALLLIAYAFRLLNDGRIPIALLSIAFGVVILVLFYGVLFDRELIRPAQPVFYYSIIFYLLAVSILNIQTTAKDPLTEIYFIGDTLNGVAMWYAIVYLSSYFAMSKRQTEIFMFLSLIGLFAVMLYHIFFGNGAHWIVLIRWFNAFAGLFVMVVIIRQTGQLQKNYIERDYLTGALNRREVHRILNVEIERALRYAHPLSVVLVDVDYFKRVNDRFGHLNGDQALKEVVQVCQSTLRVFDTFGRWGGEEFLVILPETDTSLAAALAERLRAKIAAASLPGVGQITASFGVAAYTPLQPLDHLVQSADQALYRAKQNGRNQVAIFQEDPDWNI
jgi:diguanylate cyclase (GGDEF)-like protein